jgi:hypothetical protein
MRENCPFPATQAETLPGTLPTVSPASDAPQGGHSPANRTAGTMKEQCSNCTATDWQQAHFIAGRLLCETCWSGREPAVSMVPTPAERQLLIEWIRPLNRGGRP